MLVRELGESLGYKVVLMPDPEAQCLNGYTSDLLSDVMGNAPDDSVLVTIQGHRNTMAVASLVGIRAVVLCNGRGAPDDMVSAASQEGIAIFATADSQFTASWKIAKLLGW